MPTKTFDGFALRFDADAPDKTLEVRPTGGAWERTSKTRLSKEHEASSDVWAWLTEHGFERPRSGTAFSDADYEANGYGRLGLRLPKDAIAKIEKLQALEGLSSKGDAIVAAVEFMLKHRK